MIDVILGSGRVSQRGITEWDFGGTSQGNASCGRLATKQTAVQETASYVEYPQFLHPNLPITYVSPQVSSEQNGRGGSELGPKLTFLCWKI